MTVDDETTTVPKTSAAIRLGPFVRIAIAVPLLALSCWVLLPFSIVPVSSMAVTNARISHVRTLSAGEVRRFHVEVGDRISAGQTLVEVSGPPQEIDSAGDKLMQQKSEADFQATVLTAQIAEAEKRLSAYDRQAREYSARASRNLEVDAEIARLETTLAGLRLRFTDSHPEVRRVDGQLAAVKSKRASLAQEAGGSSIRGGSADAHLTAAATAEGEVPEFVRHSPQIATSPAGAGAGAGPSVAEQPLATLSIQAAQEVSRLRQEKLVVVLRQRALAEQLEHWSPPVPVADVRSIPSPVDGIVWSRDVPAGQTTREGDELIRIAETDSIQVVGYVDARFAQRISVRDRALIYLGNQKRRLSGTVTLIQETGQRSVDADSFAIDLKLPYEGLYRFFVQLDPADREETWVGQVAKVVFPGPDSSVTSRFYSWLSRF